MSVTLDVLAIFPHPGDAEVACGGTLLRMADLGHRTGILDLTAGEMGTRATLEQRLSEAEASARLLGLAWRDNQRMPDARLENTITARMTIAVRIRELKPKVVILPYWDAPHPDATHCSAIATEACFLAGLAKLDEYSDPHSVTTVLYAGLPPTLLPSFVVETSAQLERQLAAIRAHQSQRTDHLHLTGVEPFFRKSPIRIDDLVSLR
jgi:bacillithiol biosynthesis deacetylase BshB1